MKIVFRVNFYTVSGQSLWLKLAVGPDGTDILMRQVLELKWLNEGQWQGEFEVEGTAPLLLQYSYQLRDGRNGVVLDEWGAPRRAVVDPVGDDAALMRDSWRSAGSPDRVFETKVFTMRSKGGKRDFAKLVMPEKANHVFELEMAEVPDGLTPCLLGGVSEIGDWRWHAAARMVEVRENVWQVAVFLPDDWRIEYKYGLFDAKKKCTVGLEDGENRVLESRALSDRQMTFVTDECYRRSEVQLPHGAGVAVPVFSLRSAESHGVGEFADLVPLADWSADTGFRLIQILPINDTTSSHDWTDSYPYSAISTVALHPLYLRIADLDYKMPAAFTNELAADGKRLNELPEVDYEAVMESKLKLTRAVYDAHKAKILKGAAFREFLDENGGWVLPYAVFCVKRDEYGTADFPQWGEWAEFDRERVEAEAAANDEVFYHVWLQMELDRQLGAVVKHLHAKGVALKGDLPIGIDRESVDAWVAPHLFKMDCQAGAPPDAFAIKGQNWGFPTYNWEEMAKDGYAWWKARFERLSRYFDAYRIDHILGFFRIWQIPEDQVEGIMGWFDPAVPVKIDEIRERGIEFDYERFCKPWIRETQLFERFGDAAWEVRDHHLVDTGDGGFQLKEHVSTQKKIMECFAGCEGDEWRTGIRNGLLNCASDVLFFEVEGSNGTLFHPRCSIHMTRSFNALDDETKARVDALYVDYFFRRQEDFWQARALEKLPVMRGASDMLLCGEDLGMVPDCVPGVLRETGILSLEIQRMPKKSEVDFADPAAAPYMSVVSPSTHDMSVLRAWWREDRNVTRNFARQLLGVHEPEWEMSGETVTRIIHQHLRSPAMWAVFPLQDLLGMDEQLRHPEPEAERINVPAIHPYYWRYRMHFGLEELAGASGFRERVRRLLELTGRV
ncbi:MAG: 4-alpha-glucanotransferase [Verrucomicrobiales bacterium]